MLYNKREQQYTTPVAHMMRFSLCGCESQEYVGASGLSNAPLTLLRIRHNVRACRVHRWRRRTVVGCFESMAILDNERGYRSGQLYHFASVTTGQTNAGLCHISFYIRRAWSSDNCPWNGFRVSYAIVGAWSRQPNEYVTLCH